MSTKTYAIVTSVIFFVVALIHLLRLVLHWEVMIDGWLVPEWVSIVGVIVPGYLSFEGFRHYRQGRWFSWLR